MIIRICKYCNNEFSVKSKYSNKKHCNYVCRFKSLMPNTFNDDCVEWPLSCNPVTGYGQISTKDEPGGSLATHRIAYEIYKGNIPDLLLVRHTCDNRKCVNPNHLMLGTQNDNIKDMWQRGRQPKYGYDFKGEKNPFSKLKDNQVLEIKKSSLSHNALAEIYGVSSSTIGMIKAGETWTHI